MTYSLTHSLQPAALRTDRGLVAKKKKKLHNVKQKNPKKFAEKQGQRSLKTGRCYKVFPKQVVTASCCSWAPPTCSRGRSSATVAAVVQVAVGMQGSGGGPGFGAGRGYDEGRAEPAAALPPPRRAASWGCAAAPGGSASPSWAPKAGC